MATPSPTGPAPARRVGPDSGLSPMNPIEALRLRPYLVGALVLGVVLYWLVPHAVRPVTRGLIAWCASACLYMLVLAWRLARASQDDLRDQASRLDDSAVVILVLAVMASVASFAAVVAELYGLKDAAADARVLHLALGGFTVVCSWFFTQVIFTIHYMHIYYGDVDGGQDDDGTPKGRHDRGGLDFGGDDDRPDFWDFAYFTASIGATAQTSDTVVTSGTMRRIVLAHSIYAFFFNTAILALTINIAASLLQG